MNYYALIPLCACLINFFTFTYILAQKRKSPVNRAYLLSSFFSALWMFELFILWSPIDEAFLLTWEKVTTTTGFFVGFFFLNFVYTFLKKKRDVVFRTFLFFLILSSLINMSTHLYIDGYTKYYWGVSLKSGPLYVPIVLISIFLPTVYSIFLAYRGMQASNDSNVRRQLQLLFQGTSLVIFIGLFSDVILPHVFGLTNILRIGVPFISIQYIFVFMAVKKYNFLSIGVEEISHDLFTNVQDGIILVDNNESTIQINDAAKALFDIDLRNLRNVKISKLFEHYDFQENYRNYETSIRRHDTKRIVSLSQATVRQANVDLGKILIVRDITETKAAEQELHESKTKLEKLTGELVQANASLEQKVAERTRSLLRSNEQLQREITERTRAEEALAAEKELLSVTLRSIGDGVITTDTMGNIVLLNEIAERLTGWRLTEAMAQPLDAVFRIYDEKTRQPRPNPVMEALHTESIVSRAQHTLLVAKDRTEHIVAESAAPIRSKEGKVLGVVLVFRDMTDRRRIEEELIKADKLESIGVLAGGIAHDFNNILTAIIGNISLAKMYANTEEKVFTRLVNTEKAALQAQNLTQQLLTFSKGGSLVRKPMSIGDLIRDCIDFSLRGSNVKCEYEVEKNIWPVEIDEGQISQVMNNLIINANQAMPEGGIIHVQAHNVHVGDGSSDYNQPLRKGRYVRISVKDSGVGIAEEHLSKIFDPYFTTKQKGSGLGLFTCYSIVKKHDGHLAVESLQGVGSTFHVYLPASERRVRKVADKKTVQVVGRGKILVMEDDATIREVTGEMLGHYGYTVAFARDGAEAIALYRQAQQDTVPFDVVIMDLTIPGGMGAKETIARLLALDPRAKAIVASGYGNDPIMVEFAQHGFCERIVKPYKSEELHEMLHRIIAAPSV